MGDIIVGAVPPRIQYVADGVQDSFSFPFAVFAAADVAVVFGDDGPADPFTVSGAGASAGGSVQFVAPPAAGTRLTIRRAMAIQRATDFLEAGDFRAAALNEELDRLTMMIQQADDRAGRAALLPPGSDAAPLALPAPAAGMYLRWSADGLALETVAPLVGLDAAVSAFALTLLDDADAMAAQATLGISSFAGTLLDDTTAAAARATLGALAADGDGAQLASVNDAVARRNNVVNAFRIAMLGTLAPGQMIDAAYDVFADASGIDAAASIDETYSASGDFYVSVGAETPVSQAAGSAIGNLTGGGGLAKAFDGATSGAAWAGCAFLGTSDGQIGKDWGAGVKRQVVKARVYGSTTLGFDGTGTPSITFALQGSDDGSGWTTIASLVQADPNNSTAVTIAAADPAGVTPCRYHRMRLTGLAECGVGECEFFELPTTAMTLIPNAVAAGAQPDDIRLLLVEQDVIGVAALDTDLLAYASRDGGATWTQGALAKAADYATGQQLLVADVDVSAQPAGTSLKWKLVTANGKSVRVHAVGLAWS